MAHLFKNNPRVKIDSSSFSFSAKEWKRLKDYAEFEGKSVARFVSLALREYLKELECDMQKNEKKAGN